MAEVCEPCKEITTCLRFPLVFFNLGRGKSYTNDAMVFTVECPNGPIVVTIPAGTINYTFPFPVGYDGEYPPLVLPCTGGAIIRTLNTGATQEQIDTVVNEMIATCAQQQANAQCPPAVFGNDQVFFVHECAVDETLTFSGTLPSWITLDTANSQLVGAAGTYSGSTKAEANTAAQNALNAFGTAALTSGDLSCTPVSSCIAQVATIAAVLGGNSTAMIPSRDTLTRRVVEDDATTPQLVFINTATDAVVGTNPFNNAGNGGAFATSTQNFFFADAAVPGCKVTTQNGVNVGSVTTSDIIIGMMYSPVQDRLYSIYPDGGTFTDHLISINPNTLAQDNNVDTGGSFGAPSQFVYNLKEQVGIVFTPDVFLFSIPALAPAGSMSLAPGGWAGGACYASNVDKFFIGAFNGGNVEIWEFNTATLLKEFTYSLAPSSINSIEYNPVSGTIISKQQNGDMTLIDPLTQTIVCVINTTTNNNAVVDVQSGKVYTEDDAATQVVVYQ